MGKAWERWKLRLFRGRTGVVLHSYCENMEQHWSKQKSKSYCLAVLGSRSSEHEKSDLKRGTIRTWRTEIRGFIIQSDSLDSECGFTSGLRHQSVGEFPHIQDRLSLCEACTVGRVLVIDLGLTVPTHI